MASYGITCALAVLYGFLARKDERGVFTASLAVFAGWVMFSLSWSEYSISALTPLSYVDVWAVTDLAIASIILIAAGPKWWAMALAGIFWAQIAMHVAHQYGGLEFAPYSVTLDTLFLGQLAILFTVGGGKVGDILLSRVNHVLDALRPPSAATQQEK